MDMQAKDMMQYGKVGMGLLKQGKKAKKFLKLKKRIPKIGKKARLAKLKKKQRMTIWNKRKETIVQMLKGFGKKTKKAAKTTGKVSKWVWKRYF